MKTNQPTSIALPSSLIAGLLGTLICASLVACSGGSSTPETPVATPTPAASTTTTTTPTSTPTPAIPVTAATPTVDAADKYVGTWVTNCENDGTDSSIGSASFTKVSANVYAGTTSASTYSGTACAGPVVKTGGLSNMRMTIVGTKSASGVTADKIMGTATEGVGKIIMYGESTFIQTGPNGTLDADGFPDNLNPIKFYKK